MFVYSRHSIFEPNFLTPRELEDEIAAWVTGIHGLDNDNFAASAITKPKFEQSACGGVYREGVSGTTHDTTILASSALQLEEFVPGPGGTDWIDEFITTDCVVEVMLSLTVGNTTVAGGNEGPVMWVGVKIDGALVAQSPTDNGGGDIQSMAACGVVPLGAGTHQLEVVWGGPNNLAGIGTLRWYDRICSIIEAAR